MAKKTTLKDIARELGVSTTTVSNAFNRPDQLSEKLRTHIVSSANALGYYGPSAAGRMLRTGKSGTIGIMYYEELSYALGDPMAISFMQGVASVCDRESMCMTLLPSVGGTHQKFGAFNAVVDHFIIHSCYLSDELVKRILSHGSQAVVVDGKIEGLPSVTVQDREGAKAVAKHLIELGHTQFGVLSFRMNSMERSDVLTQASDGKIEHYVAAQRLSGFIEALNEAGIPQDNLQLRECDSNSEKDGYDAAMDLLIQSSRPTGILCMSDRLACGVMSAGRHLGMSVPADLSVTGFDDIDLAASCTPALTTVEQFGFEKGKVAAELVISTREVDSVTLPAKLIVRDSTAAPPATS